VVAVFNGGKMTSDAGALLLGATDRSILLVIARTEQLAIVPRVMP
jgi:hypothetical protein